MLFFIILAVCLLPLQIIVDQFPKFGGGINFQNIITLILIGGWFLSTVGTGKKMAAPNNGLNKWLVIYIIFTFLALYYGVLFSPVELPLGISDERFVHWKDEITSILMFFIVANVLKDDRSIKILLFFMAITTPYIFYVYLNQYELVAARVGLGQFSWELKYINGVFSFLGSNEMAAFYVHAALFFLGVMIFYPNWLFRIYLGTNIFLYIYAIVISLSRGAWLALGMGIMYLGTLKSRKLLIAFIIFLSVAPVILPVAITSRAGGDESSDERLELWKYAAKWGVRYPLGIGYQCFRYKNEAEGIGRFLDTHNFFLRSFAEMGPLGLIVVLMIFYKATMMSVKLSKQSTKPLYKALGIAGTIMLIGSFIGNVFGDRFSHLPLAIYQWTFIGMVGRAWIFEQEAKKQEEIGKAEREKEALKDLLEKPLKDDFNKIKKMGAQQ